MINNGLTQTAQGTDEGDKTSDPFATSEATGYNGYKQNALSIRSSEASQTTPEEAISKNSYVAFTITPQEDLAMSLSLLEFKLTMSSNNAADQFFVRSSLDNYAADLIAGTLSTSYQKFSINLAEMGFMKLDQGVTFRIYLYGGSSGSSSARNYLDKVLLQGTVSAVPEPGSVTLLAAGLGGLQYFRRRWKQKSRLTAVR